MFTPWFRQLLLIQIFYTRLKQTTRQMINTAARSILNSKTPEVALELIKDITMIRCEWNTSRGKQNKMAGVYDVDTVMPLQLNQSF